MHPAFVSVIFLALSSSVMVVAWYGHLRFKSAPIWLAIVVSWGIALVEYMFQVPANRIGHEVLSAAQLRVVAEFFTLAAFLAFSTLYLKEPVTLSTVASFVLILAAVAVAVFKPLG